MSKRLDTLLEQLNQHHRRGECRLLLRNAKDALMLAEQKGATLAQAQILFLQGCAQIPTRKFYEAENNLTLAADIFAQLDQQTSYLRCIVRQAKGCIFKQDFPRAQHLIRTAQSEYTPGLDTLLDAEMQALEGVHAATADNDHDRAIACYERACELFHSIGEEEQAYSYKNNLASFYSAKHEFEHASELLHECISKLTELKADRHAIEARINLALLSARQYDFTRAIKLSNECLVSVKASYEPSFAYRILYNLTLFELTLNLHHQAQLSIHKLLSLQNLQLTSMQLGSIQLLLTLTETVIVGPQAGADMLKLVERNLSKETPNQAWLHLVLKGLCWLSAGDTQQAAASWLAASKVERGHDLDVFAKIAYDCVSHLCRGKPGKYPPLTADAATIAIGWQAEMHELAAELIATLEMEPAGAASE